MASTMVFPRLRARNLEGIDVDLPNAFVGERNIVVIAFQRQHQSLVDSWIPWFEERAASDPDLRFYEVPTISRIWSPARRFIDGAMAAAIRVPMVLQRTLTVYGNVDRMTKPLGITDTTTITVVFVDRNGSVLWCGRGGLTTTLANELGTILTMHRGQS